MSKYTERVEALENNEKKKKRLFTGIIVILVLIFLGGMVIGAGNVLNTEGTFDVNAVTEKEPVDLKLTNDEVIEKFSSAVNNTIDKDSVKISVYTDVDIPDESIAVASGNENLLSELKYIKPKILDSIKGYYEIYEGKFGEDFRKKNYPVSFTAADVESAKCLRGSLNGEGVLENFDKLYYSIDFPKADFEKADGCNFADSFGMEIAEKIRDTFTEDVKEIASAEDIEIECSDFGITFETDEETGKINNIWYNRGYSVTLSLSFKGDLKELGTETISFMFYAKESHWYTYAGLRLSENTLSIEKGDIKALEATKTADSEVAVKWTSSNSEIATVDEKGYVKGKKESKEPVIITAEFDYMGKTYTDSCTVYVRKPVEEIKTTPREITMIPGETEKLSVKITPSHATIKDLLWFTEDEKIATVSDDGTVTAVGEGVVKVFAVSVDGNFRSSCTVTVTEKKGE